MGSYGGHVLPGTYFIIYGFWYVIKYSYMYLRGKSTSKHSVFYCCKQRIPYSVPAIEGCLKIFMVSIGILVELFYPGNAMGKLHGSDGNFTNPMNWQHATMYFFFILSGIADIITFAAQHVIPAGFDRLFTALALFVEGYLFFFHLHGRSHIDTRVHILLVLTVWPSALFFFVQSFVMKKAAVLHIYEMLAATLLIVQGTWFWQAAYILYPPHGSSWDPCSREIHDVHDSDHMTSYHECNYLKEANLNLMFLTLFWTWHIAAVICFVMVIYFFIYQCLKFTGRLDPSFHNSGYQLANGNAFSKSPILSSPIFPVVYDEQL